MKKWLMIIFISFIITISILGSYFVFFYFRSSKEKIEVPKELASCNDLNNSDNINNDIIVTSYSGYKITPNTKVVFETYYKKCNHKETTEEVANEEIVNYNEEELQEKYKDFTIKQFGIERIVLYKENSGYCNNHYILKENDGVIAVYKINNSGTEELMDFTDISVQYLPETDRINIQNGLNIYGSQNLDKILEDFE